MFANSRHPSQNETRIILAIHSKYISQNLLVRPPNLSQFLRSTSFTFTITINFFFFFIIITSFTDPEKQIRDSNMHRSTSTTRVTDDHYSYYSSSPSSSKIPTALRALTQGSGDLPLYEPLSEAAKKERNKAKFAENAVHLIPLVLFICALVLWFFSNPGQIFPSFFRFKSRGYGS